MYMYSPINAALSKEYYLGICCYVGSHIILSIYMYIYLKAYCKFNGQWRLDCEFGSYVTLHMYVSIIIQW